MPTSLTGAEYLFVAVDHFSRYLVLAPLFDKTARSVARAFTQHVICPFTTPRVLLSDNGTELKNEVIAEICQQFGISQCVVTPYHPASNGLVE